MNLYCFLSDRKDIPQAIKIDLKEKGERVRYQNI